jgi:exonuclease VII small subunit
MAIETRPPSTGHVRLISTEHLTRLRRGDQEAGPAPHRVDELERARAELDEATATYEQTRAELEGAHEEARAAEGELERIRKAYDEARTASRRAELRARNCRRNAEYARATVRRAAEWVARLEDLTEFDDLGHRAG